MNRERAARRAVRIDLDTGAQELVIAWEDGLIGRLALARLRRLCPCAACQQTRQQASKPGSLPLLQGDARTATAAVRAVERVGRYGLRIIWADGHDDGIYPFAWLRELATAPASSR